MSDRPKNTFLSSLPEQSLASIAEHLAPVELKLGEVLANPGDEVRWVHFPESALLSVITVGSNGEAVETGVVGNEGALLLLEACASGRTAATSLVQVDGMALRAPADLCKRLALTDPGFAQQALSLFEFQEREHRQSGLCLASHGLDARLARWLLQSSERTDGRNPLPLTQEFLSYMLAVQRTTVTEAAIRLQGFGLIGYSRGRVQLLDIASLETHACDCRRIVTEHRERLLEPSRAA